MIALKKSAKSADFFIVFRLTNILLIYASLCGLPHLLLCHLLCHFFIKLYQFAIIYDNFLLYAFLSMPHKYWIFRLFLHQNRHATIKSINSCLYCSMYSYPPYLNRFPGFFFFSSVLSLQVSSVCKKQSEHSQSAFATCSKLCTDINQYTMWMLIFQLTRQNFIAYFSTCLYVFFISCFPISDHICKGPHQFCRQPPDDMSLILVKTDFFLPAAPAVLPAATDQFIRKILSGFHLCPDHITFRIRM